MSMFIMAILCNVSIARQCVTSSYCCGNDSTLCFYSSRVLSWLMETDKQISSASHSHSEREGAKHRIRRNDPSATSPVATR
jgi:hypothetical protein